MKILLTLLWKAWFTILTITTLIILIPFAYLSLKINKQEWFYQVERLWARLVFYGSGLYLQKDLIPNSINPNQPYIVISNHTSALDILIMLILFPNNELVFVGKSEVASYPIIGYCFKKGHILVDRKNRESRAKVYQYAQEKLQQGKSICFFPEGGVPEPEVILDNFKDGAFSIAVINQVPIVVFVIADIKERFPFDWLKGSPGKVRVKQLPTIETKDLTKTDVNRLKNECFAIILQQIDSFSK